jgi:hypothetical protein
MNLFEISWSVRANFCERAEIIWSAGVVCKRILKGTKGDEVLGFRRDRLQGPGRKLTDQALSVVDGPTNDLSRGTEFVHQTNGLASK